MERPKIIVVISAALALLLTLAAAPVSALELAKADVYVVQGIPNLKVDVCIDGVEVRRGFRYGQKLKQMLDPGMHKIVLKPRQPGKCTGPTIAKVKQSVESHDDLTIVAAYVGGKRGFRIFDNAFSFVGTRPALIETTTVVQHAASFGAVDFFTAQVLVVPSVIRPTFAKIKRGQQQSAETRLGTFSSWFARPGTIKGIAGPVNKETLLGKTNHHVLVGTKLSNLRVVFFRSVLFDIS